MPKQLLRAALVLAALVVFPDAEPRGVRAGTAVQLALEELVDRADLVLEARVVALEAGLDARGRVETTCTLAVDRTFLGAPLATRTVRLPGGVLPDGRGMALPGMPVLAVGEEALFFLTAEGRTGVRMPVGLAQGRLRVVRAPDGTKRLVRPASGLELAGADGRTRPATELVLDHAAVVARVAAAVAARAERARREGGQRGGRR
jgi:hypothetical protein